MFTIISLVFKSLLGKALATGATLITGLIIYTVPALLLTWKQVITLSPKQFIYGLLYTSIIICSFMFIKECRHLVKEGKKTIREAKGVIGVQLTKEERDKRRVEFNTLLQKKREEDKVAFKKFQKAYKIWLKDCNKNLTDKQLYGEEGLEICSGANFVKQYSL